MEVSFVVESLVLINHRTWDRSLSAFIANLFGEALHAELKPFSVSVTVLSPGATATSFGAVAGQRNTSALSMLMMEPLPVATTGILAMLRRKTSVVAGIFNKLVVFSNRLTPRPLQSLVMRKVMSG